MKPKTKKPPKDDLLDRVARQAAAMTPKERQKARQNWEKQAKECQKFLRDLEKDMRFHQQHFQVLGQMLQETKRHLAFARHLQHLMRD